MYGKDPTKLPHLQKDPNLPVVPDNHIKVEPMESSPTQSSTPPMNPFTISPSQPMSHIPIPPQPSRPTNLNHKPKGLTKQNLEERPLEPESDSSVGASPQRLSGHENKQTFSHSYIDHHSRETNLKSESNSATLHNGELIAAARMVNLQVSAKADSRNMPVKSEMILKSDISRPESSGSTMSAPGSSHSKMDSSSREGSIASSSEGESEKSAFNCDLCGATLTSKVAFKQVKKYQ